MLGSSGTRGTLTTANLQPKLAQIRFPTLLVAGGLDRTPCGAIAQLGACLALKTFTTVVRFPAPSAQAAEWAADPNRIRAVPAC